MQRSPASACGVPPLVVYVGDLVAVVYRSSKGGDRPRSYLHFMEDPPSLVTNARGTQLYVVGGSYRVSSRGIEG